MKYRTWEYGTILKVSVIKSNQRVLVVVCESINEAFILANHGMKELPEIDSKGQITFTKGGPTGGYWKFELT